jgi:tetratricopeptide (TPR) repeat protein
VRIGRKPSEIEFETSLDCALAPGHDILQGMETSSTRESPSPRFRIVGFLAGGGSGEVYEAVQLELNRPVALKLLKREVAANPRYCARFHDEARLTASLSHRSIVQVIDHGVDADIPWIAYELVRGQSLRERLTSGSLPINDVLTIALQLADALSAVHGAGILHRDLKPANIVCTSAHQIKLIDFGIAKWAQASVRTQTNAVMGTPVYFAPELIVGAAATRATDLYALGVILYELLIGDRPFTVKNRADLSRILTDSPTPPGRRRPDIPPALDALILRLLAHAPEQRPTEASEVLARLKDIADGIATDEIAAAATTIRMELPRVVTMRSMRWKWSSWSLVLLALVAFACFATRWSRGRHLQQQWDQANQLLNNGKPLDAIPYIEAVIRAHPDDCGTRMAYARCLERAGRLDAAEQQWRVAIPLDPAQGSGRLELGLLLEKRNRPAEAEDVYRRALVGSPSWLQLSALKALNALLDGQKRWDEADQLYRGYLRDNPRSSEHTLLLDVWANSRLNKAYEDMPRGRFREAEERLRAPLSAGYSPSLNYLIVLAKAQSGLQQFAMAQATLQQLLAKAEDNAEAHRELAHALLSQGKVDEAFKHSERAVALTRSPEVLTAEEYRYFHAGYTVQAALLSARTRRYLSRTKAREKPKASQ